MGIRNSAMSSMNTKRSAESVVASITSEDIGQFPDTNLAESMQRIPGMSIDRSKSCIITLQSVTTVRSGTIAGQWTYPTHLQSRLCL